MDSPDAVEPPDPTAVSHVLTSDLEALQRVASMAVDDTMTLLELLGIVLPAGMAPREAFHTLCLPRIAGLLATQGNVDVADKMIREAKARGGKVIDLGNGRQAVQVGRKIPGLLNGLQPPSRAERRAIERDRRS